MVPSPTFLREEEISCFLFLLFFFLAKSNDYIPWMKLNYFRISYLNFPQVLPYHPPTHVPARRLK